MENHGNQNHGNGGMPVVEIADKMKLFLKNLQRAPHKTNTLN